MCTFFCPPSGDDTETLQITPAPATWQSREPIQRQDAVVLKANGTGRGYIGTSQVGTSSKNGPSASDATLQTSLMPEWNKYQTTMEPSYHNSIYNMRDRAEVSCKDAVRNDPPSFTDIFPDPLLPPPPLGESPLLGDESGRGSFDLVAPGGGSYGGDTYVGFDDLSSNDDSARSGSVVMGQDGGAGSSPAHLLRRTPSYTSAIGGSMNVHLTDEASSPLHTGRIRQFEGKKYMGVDNHSPPA